VEKRGLPEGAYGVKPGQTYVPYVPAEKVMPEFTVYSIVLALFCPSFLVQLMRTWV